MRRLLLWLPLALFAAVLAVVASGLLRPGDGLVRSAMVGQPLPDLRLRPLLPGRAGIAAPASGRPYLLNIFASWCVPCIAELPELRKLQAAGADIRGIAVRDSAAAVRDFLARHGDPYSAIGDDADSRSQIALGSSGVPETFVIDARGRIAHQHIGPVNANDVPALLAMLERGR
jgi:cytochrome c biogenesis protein CcmG, thiol:disulfide interchange protein DsbE